MGKYLTAIQRREKEEHDRVIRLMEEDVLAQEAACRAAERADNRVPPPGAPASGIDWIDPTDAADLHSPHIRYKPQPDAAKPSRLAEDNRAAQSKSVVSADHVPAHPDHDLPYCPRNPDGSLNTYYLCSFEQIAEFNLGAPPALIERPGQWSVARQEEFIRTLAATASVSDACAMLGITRNSAYRLRWSPDAGAFRLAWDAALARATRILADTAFDRAVNGVEEDVWYAGRIVGKRRVHNDRLLMFLLRAKEGASAEWKQPERDTASYNAAVDNLVKAETERAMTVERLETPNKEPQPKRPRTIKCRKHRAAKSNT